MDTLRGRYVHEHGTGAIITNGSDDQGSPTGSKVLGRRGWYWWSSRKFRNCSGTMLVVWMLGNGEIITFGLRHFLALLLSQALELGEGRVTK